MILMWMCCLCCNAARQGMNEIFAKWSQTPSKILLDKGRESIYQGKVRNALVLYSVVANRLYQDDASMEVRKDAARALNNIGYIYIYYYYDYQKAYSYLNQAKKIALENHLDANLAYIYLNLANLYVTLSDAEPTGKYFVNKPLELYHEAFKYAMKAKKWDILQVIYNNMLLNAYSKQNLKEIDRERQQFKQLRIPKNTVLWQHNQFTEQAMIACNKHQYQLALNLLQKARKAINTSDTPERYEYTVIGLEMQIYDMLHDTKHIMEKFQEIARLVNKYDIKDLKVQYYKQLSTYYSENNQRDSANHYEMQYIKAKDALIANSRVQMASEMHFLSELQDANDKVRLLAAQQRQQQIIIWLCVVLGLGAVTSAIYFVRKNRELRRKQQALYEKMQETLHQEHENTQAKYLYSNLDEQDKLQIYEKIKEVMADISVICSPDFSLRMLAERVDTPYAKASQVVNELAGKNFNAFLGECRVKEACRRLSDTEQYGNLTIEAISASVGFKSRTNFVAMFKKVTGLTPSEYQRSARLQNAAKKP